MGLAKGERQVVLAEVEIVDVRVQPLVAHLTANECAREGFPDMAPERFVAMWLRTHGHVNDDADLVRCRRIEWRYLDSEAGA